jgi:hypothetical protein
MIRQNAHHSSNPHPGWSRGTFIGQGGIQLKLTHQCSNRAQNSEQFLIVRDMDLVYFRDHRSNVRTIEQILFKYSRERKYSIHCIYCLRWRYCKTYGIKMRLSLHSCQFFLEVIECIITFASSLLLSFAENYGEDRNSLLFPFLLLHNLLELKLRRE